MTELFRNHDEMRAREKANEAPGIVRGIADKAQKVQKAYAKALAAAAALDVEKYGTYYVEQARKKARATAERELAELRHQLDQSKAAVADTGKAGKVDPAAAMLAEQRRMRAWERARQQLDGGRVTVRDLIDRARERGDHETLGALAEELPAYADFVKEGRTELRAVGARSEMPALLDHIDAALAETVPDVHERRSRTNRRAVAEAGGSAEGWLASVDKSLDAYASDPEQLRKAMRRIDVQEHGLGSSIRNGEVVTSGDGTAA